MWETQQTSERRCSGQNLLASMQNAMWWKAWANHPNSATWWWGCFFSAATGTTGQNEGRLDGAKYWAIVENTLMQFEKAWDWGGGSSSIRTMTLNIHPKLQWNYLAFSWFKMAQSKPRSQSNWESMAGLENVSSNLINLSRCRWKSKAIIRVQVELMVVGHYSVHPSGREYGWARKALCILLLNIANKEEWYMSASCWFCHTNIWSL